MSDRFNGLLVTLEVDLRDDDAEALISAIRQLRGVVDVRGHVSDFAETIAEARVRRELTDKLWGVLMSDREKT